MVKQTLRTALQNAHSTGGGEWLMSYGHILYHDEMKQDPSCILLHALRQ